MFTFDLILKLIVSIAVIYVAANSIFHYHFTIKRSSLFFTILALLVAAYFFETTKVIGFLITEALVLLFYVVFLIFFNIKNIHGYFMFNSYRKKDFIENNDKLQALMEEYSVSKANLCYNQNRPFLFVLRKVNHKKAKKISRAMDEFAQKKTKNMNMIIYWHIIASLLIMVLIWRF